MGTIKRQGLGSYAASLLVIGWVIAGAAAPALAASATLYLSPASGQVANGAYLTVSVRENSGSDAVNAVQADLVYPASLLQFVSISSSPAYNIDAQSSGGNGTVTIARGATTPVTGDQLVASVKFKALAASGQAAVSFASSSAVESSGSNIMNGSTGGNYTLTSAAAQTSTGSASKDTIPPSIANVATSKATASSIQVTWVTSEPATSEVDYGLNQSYGLTAVSSQLVTNHSVTVNSGLTPAEKYHFIVKSADAAGNAASSADGTFSSAGLQLFVTVVNQHNQAVKGAAVELAGQKGTTNQRGQTNLTNLPAGKQTGTVTYQHKTTAISATVTPTNSEDEQSVSFKIQTSPNYMTTIIIVIAVIAAVGLAFWASRRFGGGWPGGGESNTTPPAIDTTLPSEASPPDPAKIYPRSPK